MESLYRAFLAVFLATSLAETARILGFFPVPGRSHYILGSALMRGLAERGHDVTVVSPYGESNPPTNGTYTDIIITGFHDFMQDSMHRENLFENTEMHPLTKCRYIPRRAGGVMEKVFEHENVQRLLRSNETFDVVIVEKFHNDAQQALATLFRAPLILFTSLGANFWVNPRVGNPSPPSYIPDVASEFTNEMTFSERMINSLIYLCNELVYDFYVFPAQNQLVQKYIPNGPDLNDVIYNVSLVLLNSHISINQAVPLVPNLIEVGGLHIKPPKKLPEDLQEFLDGAKDGAIYFSMGSNLNSSDFSTEKRQAFTNTFAKIKQKILWKWEGETLPDQPSNVKIAKWLPQQDILAHPNVKLFITHAGLLSTTEAVYHGVPILSIPVYGDQQLNARIAATGGYGLTLPYRDITERKLLQNIIIILNSNLLEKAKAKSKIYHDRLTSPLDTAIYWVEYVIRHKGAPHLRVAALDLPLYKYLVLDVVGLIVVVSLLSLFVFILIAKKIYFKLFVKYKNEKIKKH